MLKANDIADEENTNSQIFIDLLLDIAETTKEFDDKEIIDEVSTILVTANETTAFALSHIIMLLAIHQDIQDKVVDELRNVFYDIEECPDNELLIKLVYIEMVINETLRLFPLIPLI